MNHMKNIANFCILLVLVFNISCTKKNNGNDEETGLRQSARLDTGASANDLLSNDTFTKLKIEIAYVSGFRPTSSAMNDFLTFIRLHTFKNDIEISYKELASPDKESLTLQEVADLEAENRTVYNEGDTLGMYIYFADAPSDNDDDSEGLVTLGVVYRNTSMVIYERNIRLLANQNSSITVADIETATINHEFGHLLGLVNLGSPQVNLHEDAEDENHCNQVGCLMRAELQFSGTGKSSLFAKNENDQLKSSCSLKGKSVLKMLNSASGKGQDNAVPLGAECVRDLMANGGR